ncbi:cupin domain-containing protein [Parasphingorhabdus cellanae]|uniref:Cupin domain-containing protein n=1 Tax=Parasphingorhabdus cellanae TaxID=2806553 RepID=A0ABX7T1V2_9SPHN|nr:cupin domain-containing protein [Parasphingorhabdus cellanae]QTD55553.1 cupin domain-containing protein [Parasphingorhabdus cellanae]
MQFNNFDIAAFLQDNWQKKPLFLKNPWTAWDNPLEPDELAGLAVEEGIESRLIIRSKGSWQLEHGPLPADRFDTLGNKHWTLLVQAVDHHVPEVAALIEPFRFIPNWRIDDVMVSFAADKGGVGPHFDQYDVFLIQGAGKRRWQVGGHCNENSALLPHDDLRLLANFEATETFVCEPGDILYIPPGVSHNGIAMGDDCMTYSIGFRAPSRSDLIGHWCDDLLADMQDDDRYSDPGIEEQSNPGEISSRAVDRLHAMITDKIGDRKAFARWFGQYSSTPKYSEMDWKPDEKIEMPALRERLQQGEILSRNPASRFSFIREDTGNSLLFVDGETMICAGDTISFAETLCAQDKVTIDAALADADDVMDLILKLLNHGCLAFDLED